MKYLIVSFNNRNSLYMFVKILKNYNISNNIINTPHSISRSCGLSVRVGLSYHKSIINIIKTSHLQDVLGIFIVERLGFNERIERLY